MTDTNELIAINVEPGDEGEDYYTVTARFINMTAEDIRTLATDLDIAGWHHHAERLLAARMSQIDLPVSIYEMPPPGLVDLRTAILEARDGYMDHHKALIIGAAEQWYAQQVRDHYERRHQNGERCDCA